MDAPIKDENGRKVFNAETEFKFITGRSLSSEGETDKVNEDILASKAAIVLALDRRQENSTKFVSICPWAKLAIKSSEIRAMDLQESIMHERKGEN